MVTPLKLVLVLGTLLTVLQLALATGQISCSYANSTCSNCEDVCSSGRLFSLLPSHCHVASEVRYI